MRRLALLAFLAAAPGPTALTAQGRPHVFVARGPDQGQQAPDFTLAWASKDTVGVGPDAYGLWRDRGKVVVLAFFPHAFTPTDSYQLTVFRDRYADIFGSDAVVFGISVDSVDAHRRFAAELALPFRLLSDPDQAVAAKYGSKDDGGIDRRTIYVIGPDGRVRWRDLRFDPRDDQAYEALRRAVRAARR